MPELLHILKKRGARPSLVLVMVLLIPGFWNAQTRELDSLKNRVRTSIKDTNALNALTQLAWQFVRTGSSDSAIGPCKRALALCDELEKHAKNDNELFCIRKTQGRCFNYLGLQKRDISDFNAALEYMERSVNVFGDMEKNLPAFHDQVILLKSKTMANMAVIYHLKGDNVKALELNFNVLQIADALSDWKLKSNTLGSTGTIFMEEGDYKKAIDYYTKALQISRSKGDSSGVAILTGNLGNVYHKMGNKTERPLEKDSLWSLALECDFRSLRIDQGFSNKLNIARNLSNIGLVYADKGEVKKALEFFLQALELYKEMGNKSGISNTLGNMGGLYLTEKKFSEAEHSFTEALHISDDIGSLYLSREWNKGLSDLYAAQEKWTEALRYYRAYIVIRDSLQNEENIKKQTRTEMQYEFDKKESQAKTEQEKKDAVTKIVIWSISGGLTLVIL